MSPITWIQTSIFKKTHEIPGHILTKPSKFHLWYYPRHLRTWRPRRTWQWASIMSGWIDGWKEAPPSAAWFVGTRLATIAVPRSQAHLWTNGTTCETRINRLGKNWQERFPATFPHTTNPSSNQPTRQPIPPMKPSIDRCNPDGEFPDPRRLNCLGINRRNLWFHQSRIIHLEPWKWNRRN